LLTSNQAAQTHLDENSSNETLSPIISSMKTGAP
jgi:hypothetical protein